VSEREADELPADESGELRLGDAMSARRAHSAWADYTTRGNGERLVDAHGHDLRHTPEGGWYAWDGRRWEADPGAKRAAKMALDTLLPLEDELGPGASDAAKKFARSSQSPGAYDAALKIASLYPPVAARFEAFDDGARAPAGHARRLCALNGTVDLETGALGPHRREDMITKLAGAEYLPEAPRAHWLAFLEAAQPDDAIRAFLQRLAGYWLCGLVREEVFPIFYGSGGNGKGTFLDTLRKAMGEYAGSVPEDVMVSRPGSAHPTGLMVFRGLRLAVASETDEGDTLAIATLKRLTGGDVIRARFCGKDFVEFEPTHKLVLMTNARPRLRGSVNASLRRRIFFVPWLLSLGPEQLNPRLKVDLAAPASLAAVLSWAVDGYRLWRKDGLAPPASVLAATADYLADEDTLGTFIEDRCELGAELTVSSEALYKAYRSFCKEVGEASVLRAQDFKPAIKAKLPSSSWRRKNSVREFVGLDLRPKTAEDYEGRQAYLGPH
jgi:putative DNA primase/helicase